jgi:misacylated tRNA(Ala) deacylase
MAHLFCHEQPETLTLDTEILDARPGRVLLQRSPFYPGGGGQPHDRGTLAWSGGTTAVKGFEAGIEGTWHLLADEVELSGTVRATVDSAFRRLMRAVHTDTHILNAFVFRTFNGALVTGVQIGEDGTARMDFDVPDADNERLRALEAPINDAIAQDLPVRFTYVPMAEALAQRGLIRTQSVAPPPTPDGLIRIVEIADLDRQACGGTHLTATAGSPPIRILKIDNKGRHNRRVKIGLVAPPAGV